jgi:hypothetical protein
MLEPVPVPLQAILWPLAGAALILALRRFLPNWLRRVVAVVVTLASLSALWSLRGGDAEVVTISWAPLNFFRMSPALQPTALALFVGVVMAGAVAALVLGIRGTDPQHSPWHGLILVALAGGLLMAMAANLLTLALGSGLLDLALAALAICAPDGADRTTWRMAVPGIASTLLLLFGAMQMDAQVGSASLAARDFPLEILVVMGGAGLLRLLVFPLHPRGLKSSEEAATLLLPMGAGIYLLARVQAIGPILAGRPWILALADVALLIGGLMTWTGSIGAGEMVSTWPGIAVHQAALALAFLLFSRGPAPWPWLGLAWALASLAIWWDSMEQKERHARRRWFEGLVERSSPWRERAKSAVTARAAFVQRWRESWLGQHAATALPAIALASLAGAPLTAGILIRWPLYAALLGTGQAGLLIVAFAADTFLTAGLWAMLAQLLRQAGGQRRRPSSLLPMLVLTVLLIMIGLAPNRLTASLGMKPNVPPNVSPWGLGLTFVLPWLLGAWLARVGSRLERPLELVQRLLRLDWLFGPASRLGQRLAGVVYWVGLVGEGEGWWGWALIILALGTIFLTVR